MPSEASLPQRTYDEITPILLEVVQQLAQELHPQQPLTRVPTLDSALEREFGFDSLGRMELLLRLERTFDVQLPEQVLASAEAPRDLLEAVFNARAGTGRVSVRPAVRPVVEAIDGVPIGASTLLAVLDWYARHHPQRRHITLYGEHEQCEEITYGALHSRAAVVASGLQARGLEPGQTVALMLPTSRDFFEGFLGIIQAGGVPVPLYPPARLSQLEEHLRRQLRILQNAGAVALLTVPEAKSL
ncbi:MAG: AMP-binding protein, partial [Candidatus Tectomicrobia bacterium]|nr:AMP-binding protein [Candidatus Tectomicrobia bacterium]